MKLPAVIKLLNILYTLMGREWEHSTCRLTVFTCIITVLCCFALCVLFCNTVDGVYTSMWNAFLDVISPHTVAVLIPLPCLKDPIPSNTQHLSYDGCLEVRGEIIRTVLCCTVH